MTDYPLQCGYWFNVVNGQIVGWQNGAPFPQGTPIATVRGAGWFPGVQVGIDAGADPEVYQAALQSQVLTGDIVTMTYTMEPQPLEPAKKAQIEAVSAGCKAAIYGGFSSSALGEAYTYPTGDLDQLNLLGAYSASLNPANQTSWTTKFICADSVGNWAYRVHNAPQIQKVYLDGVNAKLAYLTQNAELATQINAINDTSAAGLQAVLAIVWVPPAVV